MAGVKVLGQSNPSAATPTTLYTCSATSFICSSVFVCNMSSTPTIIKVGICRAGVAAVDHLIMFDYPLDGNYFGSVSNGIAGKTGDNITITAGTANVAFSAYGYET